MNLKYMGEDLEVGMMDQDGHGASILPICNEEGVCMGDGSNNR